jgi:hypothetical protein
MTRDDDKILVDQFLEALRAGADFRDRKVRRLRAAIRAGAFENMLKLEVATDRLAAELLDYEMSVKGMTNDEARMTNQ